MKSSAHSHSSDAGLAVDSSNADSSVETGIVAGDVHEERDEIKEVQKLAKKETSYIRFWRLVVILSLLVTGAVVSTLTFVFLKAEEQDDYVDAYYLFANTVGDITQFRVENMFEEVNGISNMLTAHANDSGQSFPLVTPLPQFEVHGDHARVQSGIETFSYLPFITSETRTAWELFSVQNQDWISLSRNVALGRDDTLSETDFVVANITPVIFEFSETGPGYATPGKSLYIPISLTSPPPFNPYILNFDLASIPDVPPVIDAMTALKDSVLSAITDVSAIAGSTYSVQDHQTYHDLFVTSVGNETVGERPHSFMYTPVYRELGNDSSPIVGLILSTLAFDRYMADLLPDKVSGIFAVLVNSCGDSHTYELTGSRAIYLGSGELYEQAYANLEVTVPFSAYKRPAAASSIEGHCLFQLRLYPGSSFVEGYRTNQPTIFATAIAVTFFLMAMTFLIYDRFVNRRNAKVVNAAARSNAIVSSLFPSNVRDRIYEEAEEKNKAAKNSGILAPQSRLKDFLNNGGFDAEVLEDEDDIAVFKTKPIAELFPETTIMFADIAGFTAWSSSREPAQVFMLLETLYHAFDDIAKKRRVFKVETVGDCYVAVSGLPDPRKDHAVVMARFAKDCMHRMHFLTKRMEVSLGPDTAELSLRIGLHSGPVTAGVLRGERSRFQLFGDTMNTASRLESTGLRDRIQISQDTANILIRAGKAEWFKPRDDVVVAKGKGEIKTYWLSVGEKGNGTSATESTHNSEDGGINSLAQTLGGSDIDGTGSGHQIYRLASEKATRLIDWNVDILARLLKQKIASRKMSVFRSGAVHSSVHEANIVGTVLDEVKEVINLPAFDIRSVKHQQDPDAVELAPAVMYQLREYVSNVAAMYKDNSFHNFEHASHVTMSVVKLLSRIVAPADVVVQNEGQKKAIFASKLHDHTYGITSDPLTQFACVFSALIHDIDHSGVSNTQLIKEGSKIATFYKNKSVAEQNSVDLAWDLLMDSTFEDLRNLIYSTQDEKDRFRQLVVNSVMATDIMDKDLKQLRNARWEKAFSLDHVEENSRENTNRKATIVIEHLIQASDVAHTMQHWHIYRKWNERLFVEMYNAFENGRADKNPADFWYKGELGFFDFYIIPLAKKLKDCGVFGVSSDEYLNYAMRNRQEWEERGQQVVREMMAAIGINRE